MGASHIGHFVLKKIFSDLQIVPIYSILVAYLSWVLTFTIRPNLHRSICVLVLIFGVFLVWSRFVTHS